MRCPILPMAWSTTSSQGGHPPVFAKAHHLDPEPKAEFKRLESASIVHCSTSLWASPVHMVPKKDVCWRPCGDNCCLNLVTTPNKYPLPNIQDLSNGLHGCTIFSKSIWWKVITRSLSWQRTSQKQHNYAIWLVWIFGYTFGSVQCCADVSAHDGPYGQQFGGGVYIYGQLSGWLQIGKHTSFTWKYFFPSWLPMALPSI